MATPFFLTKDQATEAFEAFVLPCIRNAMEQKHVHREHLHVVCLVPGVPFAEGAKLPILFEYSIGEKSEWKQYDGKTYSDFARGKAMITWRTGLSSREVVLAKPHLLIPGDVNLWGSVIIDGVIVAVSGVKPYFDEMFARMTCAAVIAEASYYAHEFASREDGPDFLE